MKILVVRITGKMSGAELYTSIMAKEFRKYNDISLTFISDLPALTRKITALGGKGITIPVPVQEIGTKKHFLKAIVILPLYYWLYAKTIKKLEKSREGSRKGKFDILCFESMTEKIFLTPFYRMAGYKIIWIEHGPLYNSERAKIIKIFHSFVSKCANKIIVVSDDTKNDLIKGHVSRKKITVIYPWIEIQEYSPLSVREKQNMKAQLNIQKNIRIVGFSSGVNEAKGIKEFILIAQKILSKKKNVIFLVIGDGELKPWAKVEVQRLQISDKFRFVALKEIIREYVGIIDILFFPSKHREGTPAAILQAMAMGKVILAHHVGGVGEILTENETGFLYTHEDIDTLSDKIITLLDGTYSAIGDKAREYIIKHFDNSLITDRMKKVFYSLLD